MDQIDPYQLDSYDHSHTHLSQIKKNAGTILVFKKILGAQDIWSSRLINEYNKKY